MSKRISAKLKLKVFYRDNFKCIYCGKYPTKKNTLTIDHVVPLKHKGKSNLNNLVTCCKKCNELKRDLLLTQFIKGFDIIITRQIDKYL